MAEPAHVPGGIVNKLDDMNLNSPTPANQTVEASESLSTESADTLLGPAVKLKTNLAQKSKNLSAKDKAKIAEMVRGLAKFRHAEEDTASWRRDKGKPGKEKKDKGKKEKKIKDSPAKFPAEMKGNEDIWVDVDSEEETGERLDVTENLDLQIHIGDKRTVSEKKKPPRASKVGSYTQLLQTVGGRNPAIGSDSSIGMKSPNKEPVVESQLETNISLDKLSNKQKKSILRAQAHQLKMQQMSAMLDSEELGTGAVPANQTSDSGSRLIQLPRAASSEKFKYDSQSQLTQTHRITRQEPESSKVAGGTWQRSKIEETPTFVASVPYNLMAGEYMTSKEVTSEAKDKQTSQSRRKKKKGKKEKTPPIEQVSEVSPKAKTPQPSVPQNTTTTTARDIHCSAEASVSENISEVRISIPKPDHRFVIGPRGKNLQEIFNLTGVTIEVPKITDDSEEIIVRGNKFQVGSAITLMYTKCEVSRAEAEQKERTKAMLQSQMAQIQDTGQKVKGQGQQKPASGQVQQRPGSGQGKIERSQGGNLNTNQNARKGQGHSKGQKGQGAVPLQFQGQGQFQVPDQFQPMDNKGQQKKDQGQKKRNQEQVSQIQRPKSGQGQGQQKHTGGAQGHGQGQSTRGERRNSEGQSQNNKQVQKNRPRKKVFEPYLSRLEVSQGLKRGILVEGPIRINPKNFEESYVPHPDGKSDVLIGSLVERNRALNGDIVAVLLNQEGDWKLHKEELKSLEDKHEDMVEAADVKIESEEIVELRSADDAVKPVQKTFGDSESIRSASEKGAYSAETSGTETPKREPSKGDNYKSPNKAMQRYTSLSDVLTAGSPVAMKLFGRSDGDENKTEMIEARKLLVRTGRVVAIIERKHPRACVGTVKPCQDKNPYRFLFIPSDSRIPRLLIPMEDCPKGLMERPEDFTKTLYVARIIDWNGDSKMAFGKLARSLGEAGEIEPETEGMLIENGVDFDEFPQAAVDCLPSDLPWTIPESEFEYRRDFRDSCIFTIDPSTARDLDDALSCEDLGNGMFKVGVHIADVSWFIQEGSVLDRVASLRATSVYLVHMVIPMLPRLLCEQLCSLNPDEDRLAFSVEWTISESGEVEEEWFGRSVIRSCVKLSYDHAQGFIEQPDRDWTQEELPPISERFTVADIKTRVLNLHRIARNLRKGRYDGGCLRLDQVKLQYSLDSETGLPNGYWVYQQKESNSLVEEFMLLANMAVAHRINNYYPDKALLRRHPPPQEKMLENLKDQCEALGLHLDTSGAGQLQRSLWRYFDDDEYSLARMQVLVSLCSKPMQNAKYFCTGCIDDESLYRHYALNVPLYTHFTSPIRRYPDVIVHRLLGATLDYCEEPRGSPQELHKLAEHCNDKKTAAKRCSDLSSELFFAVFVKVAGPLEEKAMVMAVFDKAFDIFILKLGVTKRVYCDKLDIKEKTYIKDKKVPRLTLVWNTEDGEPEHKQIITIFSVVDCILQRGELPLQWMAIIKRPVRADFPPQLVTCYQEEPVEDNSISDTEELSQNDGQEDARTVEQKDTETDEKNQEEPVDNSMSDTEELSQNDGQEDAQTVEQKDTETDEKNREEPVEDNSMSDTKELSQNDDQEDAQTVEQKDTETDERTETSDDLCDNETQECAERTGQEQNAARDDTHTETVEGQAVQNNMIATGNENHDGDEFVQIEVPKQDEIHQDQTDQGREESQDQMESQ